MKSVTFFHARRYSIDHAEKHTHAVFGNRPRPEAPVRAKLDLPENATKEEAEAARTAREEAYWTAKQAFDVALHRGDYSAQVLGWFRSEAEARAASFPGYENVTVQEVVSHA